MGPIFSRLRGPDLAATLALPTGVGLPRRQGSCRSIRRVHSLAASRRDSGRRARVRTARAMVRSPIARADAGSVPERTSLAVLGTAGLLGAAAMLAPPSLPRVDRRSSSWWPRSRDRAGHRLRRSPCDRASMPSLLPASRALAAAGGAVAAAGFTSRHSAGNWRAQSDLPLYADFIAPVIAVLVAVGLDRWAQRSGPRSSRRASAVRSSAS